MLPWYKDGLRFKCTECGKCCTGSPGYTWVTDEEIEKMAAYLNLPLQDFADKHLRSVHGRWSLREDSKNYDCIFLKDKKCSIYPVRPSQCRTFPWWKANLTSPEAWKEAARHCEGIRDDAPLITLGTIEKELS